MDYKEKTDTQRDIINKIYDIGIKRHWWVGVFIPNSQLGHCHFNDLKLDEWDILIYRFGIKKYKNELSKLPNNQQNSGLKILDTHILDIIKHDLPKELLEKSWKLNIKIRFFSLNKFIDEITTDIKCREKYHQSIYNLNY